MHFFLSNGEEEEGGVNHFLTFFPPYPKPSRQYFVRMSSADQSQSLLLFEVELPPNVKRGVQYDTFSIPYSVVAISCVAFLFVSTCTAVGFGIGYDVPLLVGLAPIVGVGLIVMVSLTTRRTLIVFDKETLRIGFSTSLLALHFAPLREPNLSLFSVRPILEPEVGAREFFVLLKVKKSDGNLAKVLLGSRQTRQEAEHLLEVWILYLEGIAHITKVVGVGNADKSEEQFALRSTSELSHLSSMEKRSISGRPSSISPCRRQFFIPDVSEVPPPQHSLVFSNPTMHNVLPLSRSYSEEAQEPLEHPLLVVQSSI